MKNNRLYVDVHVLQTVPPSCINRDDMNSPKMCEYGGKKRARVSSQAWKRSVRKEFQNIFSADQLGFRTKKMVDLVAAKMVDLKPDLSLEEAEKLATEDLKDAGLIAGTDKKEVMFFISAKQVEELAKAILGMQEDFDLSDEKLKGKTKNRTIILKEAIMKSPSIDLCLFGRMSASDPALNYDAAAQVAHSISTHAVNTEYDYFTAVDDCAEDGGSGHLGTAEFNSSTLYRYANVNVTELTEHLTGEEAVEAVRGFVEAFIKSMPTGKQNSFANRTLPDMVYVTVRTDQPLNFAGAFEKPVYAGEKGYMANSKKAFGQYAEDIYTSWIAAPENAWHVGNFEDEKAEKSLGEKSTLSGLLSALKKTLDSNLS